MNFPSSSPRHLLLVLAITFAAGLAACDSPGDGKYSDSDHPVGMLVNKSGYVLSPYAPYHEIDVRGVPHGALVRDPSCDRVFVNP